MKLWALLFIVCLELISNAARTTEPRELKESTNKVAAIDGGTNPPDKNNSDEISFRTHDQVVFDKDSNKAADRGLVKNIRDQLLNDTSLSRSSKNVQIIVVGKEIILKGPIPSDSEQNKILNIAEKNSTGHHIRNQLEVIRE